MFSPDGSASAKQRRALPSCSKARGVRGHFLKLVRIEKTAKLSYIGILQTRGRGLSALEITAHLGVVSNLETPYRQCAERCRRAL
jgi:hypothetical protein